MFDKIFQALTEDKAISMLLIDSGIVKAHQHAAGAQTNATLPSADQWQGRAFLAYGSRGAARGYGFFFSGSFPGRAGAIYPLLQ